MHCQWAIFGLGSGTRIQIYGDWLKDKLLGLFSCFLFLCLSLLPLLVVPQEPILILASIPPEEAAAVESAHPK